MKLRNWEHEQLDLAEQTEFQQSQDLSVLANSVDILNEMLIRRIDLDMTLLEVGCGSYSIVKERMPVNQNWHGIDVFDTNLRGEKTIATKIASVSNLPYPDRSFDFVLANQSIEHWHEYHVSLKEGLTEIRRVLKPSGKAIINFPIHLHGHRAFVKGDFRDIEDCFTTSGLVVTKKTAVIDSSLPDYRGWRLCGFPDWYAARLDSSESTSYIVEYEAALDSRILPDRKASASMKPRKSSFQRALHHGLGLLIWKMVKKLLNLRS